MLYFDFFNVQQKTAFFACNCKLDSEKNKIHKCIAIGVHFWFLLCHERVTKIRVGHKNIFYVEKMIKLKYYLIPALKAIFFYF